MITVPEHQYTTVTGKYAELLWLIWKGAGAFGNLNCLLQFRCLDTCELYPNSIFKGFGKPRNIVTDILCREVKPFEPLRILILQICHKEDLLKKIRFSFRFEFPIRKTSTMFRCLTCHLVQWHSLNKKNISLYT